MLKRIIRVMLGVAALWGAWQLHQLAVQKNLIAASVISLKPVAPEHLLDDPRVDLEKPENQELVQDAYTIDICAVVLGIVGMLLVIAGIFPVALWVVTSDRQESEPHLVAQEEQERPVDMVEKPPEPVVEIKPPEKAVGEVAHEQTGT